MLTGPVEQQDVEIAALYRDAQVNYGQKNILGILATRNENIDHAINKRQAPSLTTETPQTTTSATMDEPVVENLVYVDKNGKGLLFTTVVPELRFANKTGEEQKYDLNKHAVVTGDERGDLYRLWIKFIVLEKPVIFFVNFLIYLK